MNGCRRMGAGALVLSLPVVSVAAGTALFLRQVEQKYPRMSPIHIEKCDKLDDGLFDRGEPACVNSIYGAMYLDRWTGAGHRPCRLPSSSVATP